jgi:general secretion pathway protein E
MGIFSKLTGQDSPSSSSRGKGAPTKGNSSVQGAGKRSNVQAEIAPHALIISQKKIETEIDLADSVSFHRVLSDEIGISAHLYSQICPLEVGRGSKRYVLLNGPNYRDSDDVREVMKLLSQKGYQISHGPNPNVYICGNQSLLTAVVKGQVTAQDLSLQRRISGNTAESSHWRSFVDTVSWAFGENASDIHVNVISASDRSQVRFTIGGKYIAPPRYNLPTETLSQMLGVAYQKSKGGADANFIPTKEQQCNIFVTLPSGERVMLRWASMATDDGPQVTMRLLRLDSLLETVSLDSLGYLPSQQIMLNRAMKSEGGAIIFAGVVGSGKSTTIATVMNQIPKSRKVVTLEDPREYIIGGAHANTISRPVDGSGNEEFSAKLRTLKRSAFNDLLLGEIRDRETGLVFQDVVLSGQNLYSTTHARRAIGIPDKLCSPMVGIERDVLSTPGSLKLLVYQALLPVNCPKCKIRAIDLLHEKTPPHAELMYGTELRSYLDRIHRLYAINIEGIYLRNPNGCSHCHRPGLPEVSGYKGRTVVAEMVEPDERMLECMKAGDNLALQRYVGSLRRTEYNDPNMDNKSTMECAIYKLSQGQIDPREIEPRFAAFESVELTRKRLIESGGDVPYLMRLAVR